MGDSAARLDATPGQRRLLVLEDPETDAAAYNVSIALDLRGAIDTQRLIAALERALGLHMAFRTALEADVDGIVQTVHAEAPPIPVEVRSVDGDPSVLDRLIAERSRRRFDLHRPPLVRVHLLTRSAEEATLLLVMHHAVTDGVSLDQILMDCQECYRAGEPGGNTGISGGADLQAYLDWRSEYVASARHDEDVAYWQGQLTQPPRLFDDLPSLAVAGVPADAEATSTLVPLAPGVWQRAVDTARALGCTEQILLNAVVAAALGRCAGAAEVLIGMPYSERNSASIPDLVGFFVNTLPVRTVADQQLGLEQLLLAARKASVDAMHHSDLPYDRIVEAAGASRRQGRDPLLDVFVGFEPAPFTPVLDGLTVSHRTVRNPAPAKFPVSFLAVATEDAKIGARIVLESDPRVLDPTAASSLADTTARILWAIAEAPRTPVRQIAPGRSGEEPPLTSGPGSDIPASIVDLMLPAVRARGDAEAVRCSDKSLSYRQLDVLSARLAWHLRERGASPGDIIGFRMERQALLPVVMFGILRAGCAYLPLDTELPAPRTQAILAASQPSLVIADEESADCLGGQRIVRPEDWAAGEAVDRAGPPDPGSGPDDLAYVLFTSGSTGTPKGVRMPHRPLVNLLLWQDRRSRCGTEDTTLSFASAAFDVCFQEVFSTFLSGGCLVIARTDERRDPVELARLIVRSKVNRIFMPFVALEAVLGQVTAIGGASLREVVTAGEQLRMSPVVRKAQQTFGFTLDNQYGPTESHVVSALLIPPDDEIEDLPSIGTPVDHARIEVVDETGTPVPRGWPGELWLGGPVLAQGYLGRPDLTSERFVDAPFGGGTHYRTGDRGRLLEDGSIAFLGRTDNQVKIAGHRVETGEIEHLITAHPGVAQAAVVAVEQGEHRYLAAFLIPEAGADALAAEREVREELGRSLPPYMRPHRYRSQLSLPLTVSRKVDRQALARAAGELPSERADEQPIIPDRNDTQARIWDQFAELLPLAPTTLEQTWFELGGHSLVAARIAARLRAEFDVDLRISDLFTHASVGELAELVARLPKAQGPDRAAPAVRTAVDERLLPLTLNQEASLRKRYSAETDVLETSFNLPPYVFRMDGQVQTEHLLAALGALTERHEALRVTFDWNDGRPQQRICDTALAAVETLVLDACPEERGEQIFRDQVASLASRPFDLHTANRLRVLNMRFPGGSSRIAFVFDHMVCDQVGAEVCLRDLATLYTARCKREPVALPPVPHTYRDYVLWDRGSADSEWTRQQLDWWNEQLGSEYVNPTVALNSWPEGHGMAPVRRISRPVGSAFARLARQAASDRRSTPFAVVASVLQEVLLRRTGQAPPVVSPYANRDDIRWTETVAYLSHRIVVPPSGQRAGDVRQRLSALTEWIGEARARFSLPLPFIQEKLAPEVFGRFRTRPWLSVDVYEAVENLDFGPLNLQPLDFPEDVTDRQSLTFTLLLGRSAGSDTATLAYPEGALPDDEAERLLDAVAAEFAELADPGAR
ncbi:amino acid adenylation domain-containing protein [Streptomyces sp. NPDC094038]|uniref:non-ribosomal peptide synthetase n=1 Tax=Streptomyces sp. NPDC094038 TaxID=3366055 RepID=UPI003813B826